MQISLRHILSWSTLIAIVGFVASLMAFFFNLSGYNINVRWIFIPCIALALFLIPSVTEWIKK